MMFSAANYDYHPQFITDDQPSQAISINILIRVSTAKDFFAKSYRPP